MTKTDVVGYRYHDIVLYAAQILCALGEKVYIKDMSTEWELHFYVPGIAGFNINEPIEYKGVSFGFGRQKIPADTDYLFNLWEPEQCASNIPFTIDEGGHLLVVTDEEPVHEDNIERAFEYQSGLSDYADRTMIIFRDYSGVNDSFCENTRAVFENSKLVKLAFNKKDREAEVFLWIREDPVFKPITERMASLVEHFVCRLRPSTTTSEFERAYRIALKGDCL